MKGSRSWRSSLMPAVLVGFGAALLALVAHAEKAGPALKAAKERLPSAERLVAREQFFAARRINPNDPNFDAAGARVLALEERAQQREAALPGPNAGTVWVPIGPAPSTNGQTPQDFAQQSPVSGRINHMAFDPINGAVFAGAAQGGVWKTSDNGATWVPITDALTSQSTGAVTLAPSDHNIIFLGTGEGNLSGDSYAGVGIFKSTDNGTTWGSALGVAQFAGRSVPAITVDRTNANVVLAGSTSGVCGVAAAVCSGVLANRGIYKSTDGGATWVATTHPVGMVLDIRAGNIFQDPLVATRWYAGMANNNTVSGGLWLSTDTGSTWTSLNGVGGLPALAVPAVGINRYWITGTFNVGDVQSTLYLGTGNNNASTARGGRIYKSTDSGATWTLMTAANDYCMGQCFYDMPVYVHPGNKNLVFHGGAGAVPTAGTTKSNMRKSTDGGTTFVDIMRSTDLTTAVHSDSHEILTNPANSNELWTGNDGGVWRSIDGGTNWINRNTNIQTMQFTAFDVLQSSSVNLAYGGTQDNGTMGWTGAGVAWPHLDYGDGGFGLIDQGSATANNLVHTYFNQSNNLIGAGCTTGGFAVAQGGYDGSFAPGNGIAIADRVAFYAPMHLDRGTAAATQTLYFGTHRIWRAPNFFGTPCTTGGAAFTSLSGATDLLGGLGFFTAIESKANAVAGVNADVVCGGSSTGRVFCTADANAGTPTWTERDAALATKLYISDVLIDPTVAWVPGTSGIAYTARSGFYGVASNDHVRKTTDGGTTWSSGGTGIPDIPVNALAIDPLVGNRLWAGTDAGVYVSNNAGGTWAPYGTGLPNAAVFDMKTSPLPSGQGAILLVTHGRGAYRLSPLTPVSLQRFDVQ